MNQLENLNCKKEIIQSIKNMKFDSLTPIQEKTLPYILDNQNLIAKAKTGSGKTLAFGIGLLEKLEVKNFKIQSIVLCPTRELADQVAVELRKLAKTIHNVKILTLCGGVPFKPQVHSLYHQAHIVVGTPGRILKHFQEDSFKNLDVGTLVLDEADRMLDMGFIEDISRINSYLPIEKQTLLFSATYPEDIQSLANEITVDPKVVEVESVHSEEIIEQKFIEANQDKAQIIEKLLKFYQPKSCVIFCNMKITCDELADDLGDNGFELQVLHSDLDQRDRDETLILFANKSYPILIATDVAARGLDIKDIDLVINFDLPNDSAVYTHRIGRTARAGKSGQAVSIVDDFTKFEDLKDELDTSFDLEDVNSLNIDENFVLKGDFSGIYINGGKKLKIGAGDILGALTAGIGLQKDHIGKINILPHCSYVAVKRSEEKKALEGLNNEKIKGKYFRAFLK
jgi:ATP-independent RNA helicase DbpA